MPLLSSDVLLCILYWVIVFIFVLVLQADDKDIGVAGLDDRGLQDLLNEAIAYKNPKDRDNKSDLFKVSCT